MATIVVALSGVSCGIEKEYYEPFHIAWKIEYKLDEKDHWQTPNETRRLKTGDCEDKAILLLDEWKKKGIEGRLVIGYMRPSSKFAHAWCEAEYKGKLYVVDPTYNTFLPKTYVDEYRYIEIEDTDYLKWKREELMERMKRGE